jgi:hypothetical protein
MPAVEGGFRRGHTNRTYLPLTDDVITAHLMGDIHAGLYPLMVGDRTAHPEASDRAGRGDAASDCGSSRSSPARQFSHADASAGTARDPRPSRSRDLPRAGRPPAGAARFTETRCIAAQS